MSVRIHCPYCNQNYVMEQLQEGFQVQCSKCGKAFTVTSKLLNTNLPMQAQSSAKTQPNEDIASSRKSSSNTFIKVLFFLITVLLFILGLLITRLTNIAEQHLRQTSEINTKLEALSLKSNPIISYKLINYTWEYQYSMEDEFKKALDAGYEPVGYVCQNSIKGGFFLFVKRKK